MPNLAAIVALAVAAPLAGQQTPLERLWIRSAPGFAGALRVAPDVHGVEVRPGYVEVTSAGLSLQSFGPLQVSAGESSGVQRFVFRIPRTPKHADGGSPLAAGSVGVFINGVPIRTAGAGLSWQDREIWHADMVALAGGPLTASGASREVHHGASVPPLLAALVSRSDRHSPLIGFARDGYPIYGPWGWDEEGHVVRLRSGYQLRNQTARDRLPDGTRLQPGQEGPPLSSEYPAGTFIEDYEFVPGTGDLDVHNARFARTPEYPDGTWAYFLSTDENGKLAYPYLIGTRYRGVHNQEEEAPSALSVSSEGLQWQSSAVAPAAGEEVTWTFTASAPALEKVHEKKLHLLVISADLQYFEHVHPEPLSERRFVLRHRLPAPGKYWLYADYTPAGEAQRIARFTIEANGQPAVPPPAATGSLRAEALMPERIVAGTDVSLRFSLADAHTNLPFTGLQPYLGAWAHVILLSEDGEEFIHAHPAEEMSSPGDPWKHSHAASGPSPSQITAAAGFRRPGRYKAWLQVQRDGQVLTFPFAFEVLPAAETKIAAQVPADAIAVRVSAKGFQPSRIAIPAGSAVRIAFVREDAQNCGSRVRIPSLGLEATLGPGSVRLLDIPAQTEGTSLVFTCGMGMYRGAVIATSATPD